jgi:truncated hemoglobin YjbI
LRELIYTTIEAFYKLAINDILIGYHFNKFSDDSLLAIHLERLTSFWEMQLTGSTSIPVEAPFHLLFTHLQLKIKRGELGRWIILFHQTLDLLEQKNQHPQINELTELWKERIQFFEQRFISHPNMFKSF